jgi:hypothetical protein
MQEELFDHQSVAERVAAETLIVDVDGFEGPLDLLKKRVSCASNWPPITSLWPLGWLS